MRCAPISPNSRPAANPQSRVVQARERRQQPRRERREPSLLRRLSSRPEVWLLLQVVARSHPMHGRFSSTSCRASTRSRRWPAGIRVRVYDNASGDHAGISAGVVPSGAVLSLISAGSTQRRCRDDLAAVHTVGVHLWCGSGRVKAPSSHQHARQRASGAGPSSGRRAQR